MSDEKRSRERDSLWAILSDTPVWAIECVEVLLDARDAEIAKLREEVSYLETQLHYALFSEEGGTPGA